MDAPDEIDIASIDLRTLTPMQQARLKEKLIRRARAERTRAWAAAFGKLGRALLPRRRAGGIRHVHKGGNHEQGVLDRAGRGA